MLLNGWKEIAAYLKCSVRTVQRWELVGTGLPVHRPKLGAGPVCAFSDDLDEWLKNTPRRTLVESAPEEDVPLFPGFRYKVLVVDDDENLAQLYSGLLVAAGYEVRTATNGFEALAVMREGGVPDLLVSDLNMPGMSGFELLSIIRKRFPGMAVVAVSAAFAPLNRPAILADAFVEKAVPDCADTLLDSARDLLSRSPLRAQLPKSHEAIAWLPSMSNGYVVVTCTDCLRSFSVPASETELPGREHRTSCVHCGVIVMFRIDTSSIAPSAPHSKEGSRVSKPALSTPAQPTNPQYE